MKGKVRSAVSGKVHWKGRKGNGEKKYQFSGASYDCSWLVCLF